MNTDAAVIREYELVYVRSVKWELDSKLSARLRGRFRSKQTAPARAMFMRGEISALFQDARIAVQLFSSDR